MKQPQIPPPLNDLLFRHQSSLSAILQGNLGVTARGRYEHWDRLRRLPAPRGLSHEQWWLGVKVARMNQYRQLPLRDVHGHPFAFMLPDAVQEALHRIDSQARGWIGAAAPLREPSLGDRFVVSSLIEEAIASSQLEGASTTRAVARDMVRAGRQPHDLDERMIFNNYRAMQSIRSLKNEPLTVDALRHLHATITEDTLADPEAAGRLQHPDDQRVAVWDDQDGQVLHEPPSAGELPQRMAAMIRFANDGLEDGSFLHPVIHAIALHFWLAYDHPFTDGNGRTARALFYWAMLHRGYWMFEFASISRLIARASRQYARAFLHVETDGNDLTYFVIHQVELILRALDDFEAYVDRKTEQTRQVEQLLKGYSNFNHRQLAMLSHALRHADAEYSIRSHMTSHNIAYATARADLFRLAELDLLKRRRMGGKTYAFSVPGDLERRIRSLAGT